MERYGAILRVRGYICVMSFACFIPVSFGDFCSRGQYILTRADCAIFALVTFLSCFKSKQCQVYKRLNAV